MYRLAIFCGLLLVHLSHQSVSPSASVELNALSFNKVIKKFEATLVKFDVAYPYGDKHEAYVEISRDAKDIDELLVAEVGIKDYGERDNEQLAKKFGVTKENLPVVKLFLRGKSEPITFDDKKGFTTDELRRFVREHTGLYLSLPGCVRELDNLAIKFLKANSDERRNILQEVEVIQKNLNDKDASSGKIYKTIMDKIIEKGDEFTKTEIERVKKLLSGKVSDEKKKELNIRLNILQAFQITNLKENDSVKEDL